MKPPAAGCILCAASRAGLTIKRQRCTRPSQLSGVARPSEWWVGAFALPEVGPMFQINTNDCDILCVFWKSRLSESNVQSISGQIEELYLVNSRNGKEKYHNKLWNIYPYINWILLIFVFIWLSPLHWNPFSCAHLLWYKWGRTQLIMDYYMCILHTSTYAYSVIHVYVCRYKWAINPAGTPIYLDILLFVYSFVYSYMQIWMSY